MTDKERINVMLKGELLGRLSVCLMILAGLLIAGKSAPAKSEGVKDVCNAPSSVVTNSVPADSVRAFSADTIQRVR